MLSVIGVPTLTPGTSGRNGTPVVASSALRGWSRMWRWAIFSDLSLKAQNQVSPIDSP